MGIHSKNLNDTEKEYLRAGIIMSAKYYHDELINRRFLVVTEDYDVNTICFLIDDFLHLTGLRVDMSKKMFFEMCVSGKIAKANIKTSQKYDYRTIKTKNEIIRKLNKFLCPDDDNNLFLKNILTQKTTFSFAISNISENMTLAFKEDDNHARSIRKATQTTNFSSSKLIIAIFELNKDEDIVEKQIYSKGFHMDKSTIAQKYKLSTEVKNVLYGQLA